MEEKITRLIDWMTTPEIPFASKLTNVGDSVLHNHSFFEIFYITEGSILHKLNGKIDLLQKGSLVVLKPEDAHIFLRDENTVCTHRDIVMRKAFFKSVCEYISPSFYEDFMQEKTGAQCALSFNQIDVIEKRLQNFELLSQKDTEKKMAFARIITVNLLQEIIFNSVKPDNTYPVWLDDLLQKFNNTSLLSRGINAITEDFYFSKEHICRTFKKYIGMTMTDYLNLKRLDTASSLLVYTDKTVSTICYSLGFQSISYFNKIFKKRFGVFPTQFRKNSTIPTNTTNDT